MSQNSKRKDVIENEAEGLCLITMAQTQALVEVLRAYFEAGVGEGGRPVDVSDNTIVSFLYQIDENLSRMQDLVDDIVKERKTEPVKLRAVKVG